MCSPGGRQCESTTPRPPGALVIELYLRAVAHRPLARRPQASRPAGDQMALHTERVPHTHLTGPCWGRWDLAPGHWEAGRGQGVWGLARGCRVARGMGACIPNAPAGAARLQAQPPDKATDHWPLGHTVEMTQRVCRPGPQATWGAFNAGGGCGHRGWVPRSPGLGEPGGHPGVPGALGRSNRWVCWGHMGALDTEGLASKVEALTLLLSICLSSGLLPLGEASPARRCGLAPH